MASEVQQLCRGGYRTTPDTAAIFSTYPAPPLTLLQHRDPRLLCRLGTRSYCPGEILFRCRGNAGYMLNINC